MGFITGVIPVIDPMMVSANSILARFLVEGPPQRALFTARRTYSIIRLTVPVLDGVSNAAFPI